jgi:hypothetical protein
MYLRKNERNQHYPIRYVSDILWRYSRLHQYIYNPSLPLMFSDQILYAFAISVCVLHIPSIPSP